MGTNENKPDAETVADIVREMREMKCHSYADVAMHADFCGYADRIEDAAKREREEVESDALSVGGLVEATRHKAGNAAAMREALESTEELLEHFAKPGTMFGDAFAFHMRDNRAALSAPPRNCDRYPTLAEAVLASGECTAEAPSLLGMGNAQLVRFARWLFAKATEEGESNGSK